MANVRAVLDVPVLPERKPTYQAALQRSAMEAASACIGQSGQNLPLRDYEFRAAQTLAQSGID